MKASRAAEENVNNRVARFGTAEAWHVVLGDQLNELCQSRSVLVGLDLGHVHPRLQRFVSLGHVKKVHDVVKLACGRNAKEFGNVGCQFLVHTCVESVVLHSVRVDQQILKVDLVLPS